MDYRTSIIWSVGVLQVFICIYFVDQFKDTYQEYESSLERVSSDSFPNAIEELESRKLEIVTGINKSTSENNTFTLYLSPEEQKEVEKQILANQSSKNEILEPYLEDPILSIPDLGIEIKTYRLRGEQTLENLEEVLTSGPVRYSKKDIIHDGATVIYGHSSQGLFTKSFYSFFRTLPLSNIGQKAMLSAQDEVFTYSAVESKEIETNELSALISYYDNLWETNKEKYVVLVTCFPINTIARRWIVVYKKDTDV